MKLRSASLLLSSLILVLPLLSKAADEAVLPIEQQLFNDFAVRMQDQLHRSAALLDKIAQSKDAQQRGRLMSEYHKSMRTTMKIDHLMHQVAGGGDADTQQADGGMMMKGKKMGGMSCCSMMGKKGAGKAAVRGDAATSSAEDHAAHSGGDDSPATEPAEGGEEPAANEHEKHH
jgi:hypothetical protein